MKTIILHTLLFIFTTVLLFPSDAWASKDWSIPRVEIDAEIRADGTILYTEYRTYRFEGSFSEVDYNLPKAGFTHITDLRVFEGDTPYLNLNTREPGTFRVRDSNRNIDITIFYRATDEEKTFTIQYVLHGAVVTGPDWAEFNWVYLSDRWERPTGELLVVLGFPEDVAADDIHTWIRGAAYKTRTSKDYGVMRAMASDIPRTEYISIRTLFPSAVLSAAITDPELADLSPALVREQEELWLQEQRERREASERNDRIAVLASMPLTILGLIILIVLYTRYAKKHPLPQRIPHEIYELPSDEPPALLGWLYYQSYIGGYQLVATMLDLARRGYLIMEEHKTQSRFLKTESTDFHVMMTAKEPGTDLAPWEDFLLQFLYDQIRDESKPLKEIFKQGSTETQKFVEAWKKKVSDDAGTRGWYDEGVKEGQKKNLVAQLLLVAVSIAGMILFSFLFMILFISATLLALLSLIIQRRTFEGELLYQKTVAYRRALSHGRPSQFISPKDKTVHLLYAIALGVTGKRFENLTSGLDLDNVSWLYMYGGVFNPASLASTINTLVATGTTTVGTVAGGSGASAGSAGGGAGGGAR
jgi:uncharacterized membrane protein